jgi:hypothetical protein
MYRTYNLCRSVLTPTARYAIHVLLCTREDQCLHRLLDSNTSINNVPSIDTVPIASAVPQDGSSAPVGLELSSINEVCVYANDCKL